jgi:glycerophosphoryl diester phosphodiesterase
LAAIRRAQELGVDGIELDVRLSRDGHPMVIHDATVDRVMEGRGRVSTMSLAALQALRIRGAIPLGGTASGADWAGGVPTLREALALARGGARLFLDVKTDDGEPHRAIEEKLLGATRAPGPGVAVTFLSFDLLCLRRLRELDPAASLELLASWAFFRAHGRAAVNHLLDEARGLRVEGIGLHQELMTSELLGTLQEAGLAASVWNVNDVPGMRRFALMGVKAITTDRPDLLQQVLAEFPAEAAGNPPPSP